jgi:hypothetical protein
MNYPHRIRLRGPWQVQPLNSAEPGTPLPGPLTMRLPGRLGDTALHGFRGLVRFRRAFGYPGRIDAGERVWLTFAGVEGRAAVDLNGRHLGDVGGAGEFDVTSLLQQRNVLLVDVQCDSPAGGLSDEVALEVRATAFLRAVHFDLAGAKLEATGVVIGSAERPLELYLLAHNHCEAYQQILATGSGQPFSLTAQIAGEVHHVPVRVELIDGATVWYVVEGSIHGQSVGGGESS